MIPLETLNIKFIILIKKGTVGKKNIYFYYYYGSRLKPSTIKRSPKRLCHQKVPPMNQQTNLFWTRKYEKIKLFFFSNDNSKK